MVSEFKERKNALFEAVAKEMQVEGMEALPADLKQDTLDAIADDFEAGLQYFSKLREADEMKIDFLAKKIKLLQAEKKRHERYKAIITGIIADALKMRRYRTFTGDNFEVKMTTTQRAVVNDPAKLPAKFYRTKTVTSEDKTAIKAAIKAGQTVPGAQLQDVEHIKIL